MQLDFKQKVSQAKTAKDFAAEFQTPLPVAAFMVSLLPAYVWTVLEPTPGNGNIVKCLKDYEVTAPKDFFLLKESTYNAVVMNPPFSSKYAILDNAPAAAQAAGMRFGYYMLKECMKRSDIIIALMPWFTILDSDVRMRFLKNFGLKSITALPRQTFAYTRIQTCVFELVKGYSETTAFNVFELRNNQQAKMFHA